MKVFIDSHPLTNQHAGRGVGSYTRMLINALNTYSSVDLVTSTRDADVVHYPFFDLFFLTLPLIKTRPTVVTVHDTIPLVYPEAYPPGIRGTAKMIIQRLSLDSVHMVVTDSDCSTRDVVHFLHQPRHRVKTVYLAPDPLYSPANTALIDAVKAHFHLVKPYFLYVGDINYNKNIPGLLSAFAHHTKTHDLVIVSHALQASNPVAAPLFALMKKLSITAHVKLLSVPNTDIETMRGLYTGSDWYIQPSFYEGFGLPVLEAQACGAPVISSQGGSLAEIVGNSIIPFEESFALDRALASDRHHYIDRGLQNCRRFSWEQTAKTMVKVYQTCLQ
jgi:glycosyltransferase involved in cell wall biosynthesis